MTQLWLRIGFIGLAVGSIIFVLKAFAMRRREGIEFPLQTFFITLWAAAMYLSMIWGDTILIDFNGQKEIFVGRYVDWLVTTPLLLLELSIIAGLRSQVMLTAVGVDLLMIFTGIVATIEGVPNNYIWYIIGTGCFLVILTLLLTKFSDSARRRNARINSLFQTLRNMLIILWMCYPIVSIIGPEGFRVIDIGLQTALYAILDLSAKVGFGLIVISASNETLAQASKNNPIIEKVHEYMESGMKR
jgi:bacteriorhodopsin